MNEDPRGAYQCLPRMGEPSITERHSSPPFEGRTHKTVRLINSAIPSLPIPFQPSQTVGPLAGVPDEIHSRGGHYVAIKRHERGSPRGPLAAGAVFRDGASRFRAENHPAFRPITSRHAGLTLVGAQVRVLPTERDASDYPPPGSHCVAFQSPWERPCTLPTIASVPVARPKLTSDQLVSHICRYGIVP